MCIYRDSCGSEDQDTMPEERTQPCINCGKHFTKHKGWSCKGMVATETRFSKLPGDQRYLTASMRDSLKPLPTSSPLTIVSVKYHTPQWKVSRDSGLEPGQCICRIQRQDCTYHR